MGFAKQREIERLEDRDALVRRMADAGIVKECEVHDGIFIDIDGDRTDLIDELTDETDGDRAAAEKAVQDAVDEIGEECSACPGPDRG